jgi:23S rRNA pseudouridine1911/1915/1917 synthase
MRGRSFPVLRDDASRSLAHFLQKQLELPWETACAWIQDGRISVNGKPCHNPQRLLRQGQRVQVRGRLPARRPRSQSQGRQEAPPSGKAQHQRGRGNRTPAKPKSGRPAPRAPAPILRYRDDHIVVVDKPAGLTTVRHAEETAEFGSRARRYLPPTLADLLPDLLARQGQKRPARVRAVHRLDKETSGLVVFALTRDAESHLGRQMRAHSIGRKYRALVRGRAHSERIESHLVEDRGDGRRGSTTQLGEGKLAITHVHVLEELGDYALVECTLDTGRTHQIRIHLGERGTPLCGERLYDRPLHGQPLPDESGAKRPLLHAGFLEIEHPVTGKRLSWSAPLPDDMKTLLRRLRREADSKAGEKS